MILTDLDVNVLFDLAVCSETFDPRDQFRVVRRNKAAITDTTEILRRIEGVARHGSDHLLSGSVALRAILDEGDPQLDQ